MSDDRDPRTEFNDIIGLSVDEATDNVKERGITSIRAKMQDGIFMMVTQEIRDDRLNVETDDGVITSIMGIG